MDDGKGLNEIDRTLAEALDVDVSPDFAARVRLRIARAPAPTPFWHGWRIVVPLAAAAAVIAAVAVGMLSMRDQPVPQLLAVRPLPLEQLRPADVRPGRRVLVAVGSPVSMNRSHAASVPAPARTEPEVLVPREEIEMYRRLIAAAQNVPHALVVESPRDIVSVALITEITIDPIKIDLIIPSVDGEGDRQ